MLGFYILDFHVETQGRVSAARKQADLSWVSESFCVFHDLSQYLYLYLSGPAVCQRRRSTPYSYRTPEPWDVHPSSTGEETGRLLLVGLVKASADWRSPCASRSCTSCTVCTSLIGGHYKYERNVRGMLVVVQLCAVLRCY